MGPIIPLRNRGDFWFDITESFTYHFGEQFNIMSKEITLPSGKKATIKESLTRKADREINAVKMRGIRFDENFQAAPDGIEKIYDELRDVTVMALVETYAGETLTQDRLDEMPTTDFDALFVACDEVAGSLTEKKSSPKSKGTVSDSNS